MAYFSYSQKQANQPVRFTFREQKVMNNFRRKSYSQKQEKLVPIMGDFPDSSYSQKLKNPSLRLGMDKVSESQRFLKWSWERILRSRKSCSQNVEKDEASLFPEAGFRERECGLSVSQNREKEEPPIPGSSFEPILGTKTTFLIRNKRRTAPLAVIPAWWEKKSIFRKSVWLPEKTEKTGVQTAWPGRQNRFSAAENSSRPGDRPAENVRNETFPFHRPPKGRVHESS